MCNKNMRRYYKIMGCVTLIIMLAILVGLVIGVINQFRSGVGAWPIIATFLNMLATLVMGSAFANLFYSHGLLIKDDTDLCDFD